MSSLKDVIKCGCGALIPVFGNKDRVTCELCGAEYQRLLSTKKTIRSPVVSLGISSKHNPGSPIAVPSPAVTITVVDASLSLSVEPTEGVIGDTFIFSGLLLVNGVPHPGATVSLYRNGVLVGSTLTDIDGRWTIEWSADVSGVLTFYAEAEVII